MGFNNKRQIGGSIAGAIVPTVTTASKCSRDTPASASGFRAEVETEEALARGEHLLAMIDRNEHSRLTGPASEEPERRLLGLGADPAFAGTVATDRRRLLRILSSPTSAVYPGRYVTCVYNQDKALCCTGTGANNDTPDQSNCKATDLRQRRPH